MSGLSFRYEYIPAGKDDLPAVEATLANLEIFIDRQSILRADDKRAKSVVTQVLLPLYPLAQWIVANWWPLLYEAESPDRSSTASDYLTRHSFRSAGDGFSYPDLRIVPEGDLIRIEWCPLRTIHQSIDYLSYGKIRIQKEELVEFLTDFVEAVLERLNACGISEKWLTEEWEAIGSTSKSGEEMEFCIAAAYLGLDPYDLREISAESLIQTWEELPLAVRHDVYLAAEARDLLPAAKWVNNGLTEISKNSIADGKWNEVREKVGPPDPGKAPWWEGYRVASDFLRVTRASDSFPVNIESIVDAPFTILEAEDPPIRSIDAVVGVGQKAAPCLYTRKSLPESKRFVQARALYEFIAGNGASPAVLSSAVVAHQQASRAFAAELLAPSATIRKRIHSTIVTEGEISDLAAEFKVSELVVIHQIANHKIAEVLPYSISTFE
jgi:hypothetical protein